MNWYSINIDGATAFVSLFSDIGCYGHTSSEFADRLGTPRKVELFIDSCGGNTICGLNLFHLLRDFEVEVLIAGQCWSAALTMAMAGKVIRMRRDARLLIHSPSAHVIGTPAQLRAEANRLAKLTKEVLGVISGRTGQPQPVVRKWLGKDTWLNAEEALAAGLVDEIVEALPVRSFAKISPSVTPSFATEDERLMKTLLTGLGTIEVRDKAAFGRELAVWFNRSVKQV
jgi:ATP-dependent Clp protease protease subunit